MTTPNSKFLHKLSSTRVLVLGGTSGLGFAVATAALEHGATVILSSSRPEKIEAALSRLKANYPGEDYHRRLSGFPCDLAVPDKLDENLTSLLKNSTSAGDGSRILLDHIVVTAGDMFETKPLDQVTVNYIRDVGNVRFVAPLILGKLAGPFLRPATTSSITLTGGSSSAKPGLGWSTVAGYVGAIEAVTRGLAIDLAPVRVNCVVPGLVKTELFDTFFPADRLDEIAKKLAEATVVGKIGNPEDVAEAYIYFMKDHFNTGSLIHTNGGQLLK